MIQSRPMKEVVMEVIWIKPFETPPHFTCSCERYALKFSATIFIPILYEFKITSNSFKKCYCKHSNIPKDNSEGIIFHSIDHLFCENPSFQGYIISLKDAIRSEKMENDRLFSGKISG